MISLRRTATLVCLSAGLGACSSSAVLPAVDGAAGADGAVRADAAMKSDAAPGADAAVPTPDAGPCPIPLAPDLSVIANNEVLSFVPPGSSPIEVAVLPAASATSTAVFQTQSSLSLAGLSGLTRVLARVTGAGCSPAVFDAVYDIRATYAPAPPDATTTAIAFSDPRIVEWAETSVSYDQGPGVTQSQFAIPSQALGPAGTDTLAVVSLGNGGSITLGFAAQITDGDGWDFAVFENSFAKDIFLELAFVEVSSDGTNFARFDSAFQTQVAPGGNSSGVASQIGGLAGSYMIGYGTPFDLSALQNSPLVRAGTVDLTSIKYVRIVDIVGDGTTLDSFGRPIIDPLSSGPSAGFDLDGIAVLNRAPPVAAGGS